MARWSKITNKQVDAPEVDAFIKDIDAVCRNHGMSISHEDGFGAFIVDEYNQQDAEWLNEAHTAIKNANHTQP